MNDKVIDDFTGFLSTAMSSCQVVFALLLVVIVAACFLGRRVEFSRKLILSAIGITGVIVIFSVIINIFFSDADTNLILLLNYILAGILYVYAFIFFLFAYSSCKNNSESKLVYTENNTIKQNVKEKEEEV